MLKPTRYSPEVKEELAKMDEIRNGIRSIGPITTHEAALKYRQLLARVYPRVGDKILEIGFKLE